MRYATLLAVLALVLSACADDPAAGAATSGAAEAPAETDAIIEVESAEALVQDLDGLDAETVVLNVWATWCTPCVAEFPHFVRYDQEMDGEGVEVRFVSVDDARDLPAVRTFLADKQVTEPSYLFTGQTDIVSQFNPLYGGQVPVTLILGPDRTVQHINLGAMSYEMLRDAVAAVQRGETPDGAAPVGA
jgi:thiol-disulfide isomerase/thioredoxin